MKVFLALALVFLAGFSDQQARRQEAAIDVLNVVPENTQGPANLVLRVESDILNPADQGRVDGQTLRKSIAGVAFIYGDGCGTYQAPTCWCGQSDGLPAPSNGQAAKVCTFTQAEFDTQIAPGVTFQWSTFGRVGHVGPGERFARDCADPATLAYPAPCSIVVRADEYRARGNGRTILASDSASAPFTLTAP